MALKTNERQEEEENKTSENAEISNTVEEEVFSTFFSKDHLTHEDYFSFGSMLLLIFRKVLKISPKSDFNSLLP